MNKKSILGMAFAIMLLNCSKEDDEFVNLKADLYVDSGTKETTEGRYVHLKLTLSDALSEDLILKGSFSTDNFVKYINDDDYKKEFQYSTDGNNWKSESDKSNIRFANRTKELQVRIPTVDDQKLEITEYFELDLKTVDTGKNLDITNNINTITVSVTDNEDMGEGPNHDTEVLMLFTVNTDKSNKPTYINPNITKKEEKELIDGKYKESVEDAIEVSALSPDKAYMIKQLELLYAYTGLGGYVYQTGKSGSRTDHWAMGLNVAWAYKDLFQGGAPTTKYNEKGYFGAILTHEFGHLLTLNYKTQIDHGKDNCNNYSIHGGCSRPDSHINRFYQDFYANGNDQKLNLPTHVSNYARKNTAEDIAETFTNYVVQRNISESTENSSGALRKINFVKDRGELNKLKPELNRILKISHVNTRDYYKYQVDGKGNPVSCLDVHRHK